MAQWFYAQNNQQFGPYDDGALRNMLQNGAVGANDLVWRDGMPSWVPAQSVPEFTTIFQQQQPIGGNVQQGVGYGQPQQPYGQPQYGQGGYPPQPGQIGYATPYASGVAPKNWLVEAILVTLCCCMPCGVVGIIYAAQVNSKFQAGDPMGAHAAAATAKKWVTAGVIVGIVTNALAFGAQFLANS